MSPVDLLFCNGFHCARTEHKLAVKFFPQDFSCSICSNVWMVLTVDAPVHGDVTDHMYPLPAIYHRIFNSHSIFSHCFVDSDLCWAFWCDLRHCTARTVAKLCRIELCTVSFLDHSTYDMTRQYDTRELSERSEADWSRLSLTLGIKVKSYSHNN